MSNLLDPITFDYYADARKAALIQKCGLCLGELQVVQGTGRTWNLKCNTCGLAYPHSVVRREQAASVEQGRMGAERDLRPDKPGRTVEEILKDMGF